MANNSIRRFHEGIFKENPTYRQILGICPTLAVTNNVKSAMTMVGAVAFVLLCSNLVTSLIRNLLKPHLRILVFTMVIAAFVTVADRFLAAYMYDMSKALGPYVPLIIVNCIIIARCEIVAAKEGLAPSASDAIGQSLGFGVGLASISTVREILGNGTWLDLRVMPAAWPNWVIMIMPPGAFITLGLLLGGANWITQMAAERRRRRAESVAPAGLTVQEA